MPSHTKHEARYRREILVEDVMNKHVLTIPHSASIREAARAMKRNGVGCVLVKRNSELLGIVTERDIVKILASGRSETSTVGDSASKPLVVVGPKDPVNDAAKILSDRGIRRLPVLDGTRLVGILTSTDLVKFYDKLSKYLMKGVGP
jgi:CBS domain-containing protein